MFKSKIYSFKVNNTFKYVSKIEGKDALKDAVEKGVYELVQALNDKGYLTFSSCHGHTLFSGYHVDLAFPNKIYADLFKEHFKGIKHVSFKVKNLEIKEVQKEFYGSSNKQDIVNLLNSQFGRDYPDYYLIQLCILNYAEYNNSLKYIWYKIFELEKAYKEVVKRVGGVPTYPF